MPNVTTDHPMTKGDASALDSMMGGLAPDDPRHGKRGTYQRHGCRCDLCTIANTDYMTEYYKRNPDKNWRQRRA